MSAQNKRADMKAFNAQRRSQCAENKKGQSNMKRPKEITAKLKNTDIELQNYITEMEKENARLQKVVAKLQVQNVSQQNEISGLKKAQPNYKVIIQTVHDKPPSKE